MKKRIALAIAVSAILCAAVWALSPLVTGQKEPWDAPGLFYVTALIVAGHVSGLLIARPLWAHYVGSVSGQLVYELLFLKIGPLFLVGAVFLLGYSLLFFAGAFVGSLIRSRFGNRPAAG